MCGRFRVARSKELLEAAFSAEDALEEIEWTPRYNVAPAQDILVVRQGSLGKVRRLSLMRWGLIPSWAADPSIAFKMINARAETIAEKTAFKEPFRFRRCLVPADGFYEWRREGKQKLPFCFSLLDESLFAFAGVWERWKGPKGISIESCSILTTASNELMQDVHDRMPVILPQDAYDRWLDPDCVSAPDLQPLLKPYSASAMRRFRVSQRVNHVKNDDAECAAGIDAM